jgi:hypothetical protein
MPVSHGDDAQSAFPFPAVAVHHLAMSTVAEREADLSLRTTQGFVRPRVWWPPDVADGSPVAVFLADDDAGLRAAHALCLEAGCVVLALRTAEPDVATIALEWAGDHASALGADPDRLLVAGGRLAAAAALDARDNGWPALSRQVLIGPERRGWPPAGASLAGAAPATVLNAPAYAARLREAGVDVEELRLAEPIGFDWMRDIA